MFIAPQTQQVLDHFDNDLPGSEPLCTQRSETINRGIGKVKEQKKSYMEKEEKKEWRGN